MTINYYGPFDGSGTAGIDLSAVSVGSDLTPFWCGSRLYFIENTGGSGAGLLTITNDGTFIKFSYGGTALWKVRVSDGRFSIAGGFDSDATL